MIPLDMHKTNYADLERFYSLLAVYYKQHVVDFFLLLVFVFWICGSNLNAAKLSAQLLH